MSERANQLRERADQQIGTLIEYVSTLDEVNARRPCPGREKLGDGTVAAAAMHTADNYQRIAEFVSAAARNSAAHGSPEPGRHRLPRFLRGIGHRPPAHAHRPPDHHEPSEQHGSGSRGDGYSAQRLDPDALLGQLRLTRDSLKQLGELSDGQLAVIPPHGSFRFCDGERSLEQVVAALLKHQQHQLDALTAPADSTEQRMD